MSTLIFYLAGIALLLIMGYVLWSGVGRKRPQIGRAFAVVTLGLAGYVGMLAWDLF